MRHIEVSIFVIRVTDTNVMDMMCEKLGERGTDVACKKKKTWMSQAYESHKHDFRVRNKVGIVSQKCTLRWAVYANLSKGLELPPDNLRLMSVTEAEHDQYSFSVEIALPYTGGQVLVLGMVIQKACVYDFHRPIATAPIEAMVHVHTAI